MIRQWPLVGRSEELQVIADAVRGDGHARGIVISGAPGVGKTRVAREVVAGCGPRTAHRRWIVGTQSAQNIPLGAFADVVSDFGPDPLRRVREVINGLMAAAGDEEVVMGVDDAHLLDDLSAVTVHQLVTRRLATVVLTIRSGEPSPDAITTIWKDQHLERLELQPLSLSEIADLTEHVLGGPVHSFSSQRLWQYTQGNALYLRHLLEHEVHAGRMAQCSGVWLWDGQPTLSPTLAELLEARIAKASSAVRGVLDALAVTEPLDVEILNVITGPDALADAEALGLVIVDSAHPEVRLAHPMLGEVRRKGSIRLRALRARIAGELARKGDSDPRDLVRRVVLAVESDATPDPQLLIAAASAAAQLHDARLAQRLAVLAVAAGGGVEAKILHAMTNIWLQRPAEAERTLGQLTDLTSGPHRSHIATVRAVNFAGGLGQVASAERELDEALPADDAVWQRIGGAPRALIDLMRGRPRAAVERATAVLADPPDNELAQMVSIWALVAGLGELGRIDEIEPAAERGYQIADRSADVSHLRFQLAAMQANAYRYAGALASADAALDRIRRDTVDVPFEESWHSLTAGMSAMFRGALVDASRSFQDALAYLGAGDSGRVIRSLGRSWLTTMAAAAGRPADARREFESIEWWAEEPDACVWDPERAIAEASMHAAEGAGSQAISIVQAAAAAAAERGRPAWEVCLLQTATQFGDRGTAKRLAELTRQVQGPRATAAAAHAAALAAGDGDGLVEASHRYEAFGDLLAATDAAAQAVVAYRRAGLRGAALGASATAQRLAAECQGAQTLALRTATTPQPFTGRQREVISLASQGLSNKQIAERLTMSIRSVEGHIFRASQRVGANSREKLIAIMRGS